MEDHALEQIIWSLSNLKRLTYHRGYTIGSPDWRSTEFIDLLRECAGASLEYLCLTALCDRYEPIAIGFRDFIVLKELKITSSLLYHRLYESDRYWQVEFIKVPAHLIDILPPSIERMTFIGHVIPEQMNIHTYGLVAMKEQRLPRLTQITFTNFGRDKFSDKSHHYPSKGLRRRLAKAGVVIKVYWEDKQL